MCVDSSEAANGVYFLNYAFRSAKTSVERRDENAADGAAKDGRASGEN
jgi:hypothetical protein